MMLRWFCSAMRSILSEHSRATLVHIDTEHFRELTCSRLPIAGLGGRRLARYASARRMLRHVLTQVFESSLRDRKAEPEQFALDPRGTPKHILNAHLPDQCPQTASIGGRPPRL
jgi:hypothetical protein